MDRVVDTCILVSASSSEQKDIHYSDCISFLDAFEKVKHVKLVLDCKEKLLAEYDLKLGTNSFGKQWLKRILSSSRYYLSEVARLDKPLRLALERLHFDPADQMLVCAALGSENKEIVTHTFNCFSPRVCSCLSKEARIKVRDPAASQSMLLEE